MSADNEITYMPSTKVSMLAGAAAGFTVDVALFPLDTLKTRLQSSEGFLKAGGFKGVYKGMQSVALGSAPGSATFFVAYEQSAPYLTKFLGGSGERKIAGTDFTIPSNSPLSQMAAASVGELSACLIRVPIDHVKMRLQAGHSANILDAVKNVLQNGSKGGLYAGFGTTLSREIPFSMIQFPLYEFFKRKVFDFRFNHVYNSKLSQFNTQSTPSNQHSTLNKDIKDELFKQSVKEAQVSPLYSSLIGSFCGFIAAALTTPLDVARTRIMLGVDPYGDRYQSDPISTIRRIFIEGCRQQKGVEKAISEEASKSISSSTENTNTNNIPRTIDIKSIQQRVIGEPLKHPSIDIAAGDLSRYQKGGWNAIFKGVVPRTMWISIGGCVYFGAYETAKSVLGKTEHQVGSSQNTGMVQ